MVWYEYKPNYIFITAFDFLAVLTPFTLYPTNLSLKDLKEKIFENIVGKCENAGLPAFCSFPTLFSTITKREINNTATFDLLSASTFILI